MHGPQTPFLFLTVWKRPSDPPAPLFGRCVKKLRIDRSCTKWKNVFLFFGKDSLPVLASSSSSSFFSLLWWFHTYSIETPPTSSFLLLLFIVVSLFSAWNRHSYGNGFLYKNPVKLQKQLSAHPVFLKQTDMPNTTNAYVFIFLFFMQQPFRWKQQSLLPHYD